MCSLTEKSFHSADAKCNFKAGTAVTLRKVILSALPGHIGLTARSLAFELDWSLKIIRVVGSVHRGNVCFAALKSKGMSDSNYIC